jgi:hypothetical protein
VTVWQNVRKFGMSETAKMNNLAILAVLPIWPIFSFRSEILSRYLCGLTFETHQDRLEDVPTDWSNTD